MLFQLSSKYLLKYLCLPCLIRVDNKFLWFYISHEVQVFYHILHLIYLVNNLCLMETDFCKPGVNQGLVLNFNLYLLIF